VQAQPERDLHGAFRGCLDAGMDNYITKPIQGTHVVDGIRRTLSPPGKA
jgi:hypothetical protein